MVPPDFPDEISYLWEWFVELNAARPSTGLGMSPLSYTEIYSWSKLKSVVLHFWEIDAVKKLDAEFMRVRRKQDA